MSEQIKNDGSNETGIELDNITFDANGEVKGLDDVALDDVAGGLMEAEGNSGCNNQLNAVC